MTFRTADLVVTTNQSHRRIAVERGGKAPGDVYVVRSGPDLERLTVHPPDPAWRKGKRHLIVYLGEICKQDGVDHLVRALKLLRDELGRDDIHCVLVGGGPHQPTIRAYAEELGVAELCTFTGRVDDDDLCRILSSADLGVDPGPKNDWSDRSTMNRIMEYMFFGLPIVAYELTEHRVSAGPAPCSPSLTASVRWSGASSSCWTTRPGASSWARPAGSGCARSWPGSTRPRCCWPPTTGSGRRPAAAVSSTWTRRPGPDRARQRSHLGTGRDV
jgi:nucleotide-binding universal stress UspA family protein